ncbi:MAG TPA: DsbA family protein [Acidimicrobiia bacterium]|nr:DsbA family protein [Acidimicrobiia bacterium]
MPRSFAVTWDYRCPFARNAHEAVVRALRDGADWDVEFRAFSLDQVHVVEGEPAVWDRPPEERGSGVLPLTWGIAVRDAFPERFLDFHEATFAARFDHGRKTGSEDVLAEVASSVGLDPDLVAKEVASGTPLARLAVEHESSVRSHAVFGVPTLIVGDEAVFVRLMERGRVDDFERALDLVEWTRLNEFKRTRIPR